MNNKKQNLTQLTYLQTEKSAYIGKESAYVFLVPMTATKVNVAQTVNSVFGIKPKKVNIVVQKGKPARFGRFSGYRSDKKKAYVFLPAGTTLDLSKVTGEKVEETKE